MATKTPNLGLTKPAPDDFYDIGVMNENMDKIDAGVKEASLRVGDMVLSKRTSLGDKFLAANGAKVDTLTYPELAEVLPSSGWGIRTVSVGSTQTWSMAYNRANNFHVVNGYDNTSQACLWYTDDPRNGTWKKVIPWVGVTSYGRCKTIWDGTHYCTIIYYQSGNQSIACYATSLDGPWTTYTISLMGTSTPTYLQYLGGYYIIVDQNSVYYCTDFTNNSWTKVSNRASRPLGYDGTYFYTTYSSRVYYGTTPALSETGQSIPKANFGCSAIAKRGNRYYLMSLYDSGGYYASAGYWTDNLATAWTESNWSVYHTSTRILMYDPVDDYFMYPYDHSETAYIAYAKNPDSSPPGAGSINVTSMASGVKSWQLTDYEYVPRANDGRLYFCFVYNGNMITLFSSKVTGDTMTLPSVNVNGANCFIKVKS